MKPGSGSDGALHAVVRSSAAGWALRPVQVAGRGQAASHRPATVLQGGDERCQCAAGRQQGAPTRRCTPCRPAPAGKCKATGVDNVGTVPAALTTYLAIQAFRPDIVISTGEPSAATHPVGLSISGFPAGSCPSAALGAGA